jgi:hypothetical protein
MNFFKKHKVKTIFLIITSLIAFFDGIVLVKIGYVADIFPVFNFFNIYPYQSPSHFGLFLLINYYLLLIGFIFLWKIAKILRRKGYLPHAGLVTSLIMLAVGIYHLIHHYSTDLAPAYFLTVVGLVFLISSIVTLSHRYRKQ